MTKKIFSVILSISLIFILRSCSNAASASIQCSDTVNVNTPITISVSGSAVQWNLYLKVNGQTIASSNELENVEGNKTISFSGTYTPTSEGTLTVTLEGSATEASDGSTVKNFGSKSITVVNPVDNGNTTDNNSGSGSNSDSNSGSGTPTQPETKSNVATLSNLGIKGQYDFTGFRAAKTSYSVTVPNEVESVEIYAYKGQNGQKITGAGVKQLNEGANTINVVVTAEDGKTTKTYTINVERKAAETEQPAEEPTEVTEETLGLSELKIEGIELNPEFKTDIYVYTAELTKDINTLNLTTIATNENTEIEITGNENLVEGENVITIMVKDKNSDKTATYQITVNKVLENNIIENTEINNEQDNKKKIIIIGVAIAVIIIIAILVIIIKKKRSYNMYVGDEYEDDEDDEEDYNLNTVDENEYQQEEYIDESNEQEYEDEEDYEEVSKKKKHAKGKRFK